MCCVLSRFSCVQLYVILWTLALQAPLSMGYCRQEYWSGLSCPPPGDLPDPGIEPSSLTSPALAGRFLTTSDTFAVVVQPLSPAWLFVTPWTALQASPCLTISRSLLKFMSIELVIPCNHLVLCCPLLLLSSIFPTVRVFSNASALHIRWLKYWNFSLSISPSNEYSGLISFRIDRFDLLTSQRTLKSLLQHHSSKASIIWHSAFFMVQISKSLPRINAGEGVE